MVCDLVGGDCDQIKVLVVGECDIVVVNIYYLGMMQGGDDVDSCEIVNQVVVFWLNQDGCGVYINIFGVGVVINVFNLDNVVWLIEFLVND